MVVAAVAPVHPGLSTFFYTSRASTDVIYFPYRGLYVGTPGKALREGPFGDSRS